nr:MAG TPA: hypothetical protein [Caudoviricetes sp.]
MSTVLTPFLYLSRGGSLITITNKLNIIKSPNNNSPDCNPGC